jgi:nicotinamide mononucleotide transporter
MLNILYYAPCAFIGLYMWEKNVDSERGEVVKQKLTLKSALIIYPLTAVGVIIYGLILKKMGGELPFVDSTSTVLSVVAQILCIKRLAEQWILWIVIDAITVVMWILVGDYIMVTMWLVYLINAFNGYYSWTKMAKE